MDKKPPHEYIVAPRPPFDFELAIRRDRRSTLHRDDEPDAEEVALEQCQKAFKETPRGELASKHPDHKWVIYRAAYMGYVELRRLADYTNPDAMGLYIYNDWHSYGLLELIDNQVGFLHILVRSEGKANLEQLLAFNQAWSKKADDPSRIKEMWTIMTKLIWWLKDDATEPWMRMYLS